MRLVTRVKGRHDWSAAQAAQVAELSEEERLIVELLAGGKSTPEIAQALGQHRSMIWRKVQRIKAKLDAGVVSA